MRDSGSSKHHIDRASNPFVEVPHRCQSQMKCTDHLCKHNRQTPLESLGCKCDSRLLLQVVQECIGFRFSSSTSLCWLPWTILRSLLFKLLSAFWPQTAACLLASCHLQQAEHVLVKVCLPTSCEHAKKTLYCIYNHAKALAPTIC